MRRLNDRHRADLRSSGLSDETITASGIYSASAGETEKILGFKARLGMVIPYPGTEDAAGIPFSRVKPNTTLDTGDGKPAKYLSPKKEKYARGNRLYVPALLDRSVLGDATKLLVITEGEKKALKACQEGIPTIALAGVTCWVTRDENEESRPVDDLDLITWSGRKVIILFDSDIVEKEEVRWEEYKLYLELRRRGAICRVGRLPRPTEKENNEHNLRGKLGLDDFLVVRGPAALKDIVRSARAPRKPAPRSSEKDTKPLHYDIALDFLRDEGFRKGGGLRLRRWRASFWRWDGRAYKEWSDDDVRAAVMAYIQSRSDLRPRCTRHFAGNVIANLEGVCGLDGSITPPAWIDGEVSRDPRRCIALENGVLDTGALISGAEDVLLEHSPAFFSLNALPYDFDPDAQCPLWHQTLDRILPDPEARALLQEWFGYCLLPDIWLHIFIALLGEGANGKSVVCKTLANLLGEDNISAVPIERFRETHNLAGTLGKLANIVAEFEEIDRAAEGTLKSFVSGDPMEFNPKYKPTFTARPTARLVAATNTLPHVKDKSSGVWRRMIVLHFPVQIPEKEQDPHLTEKLVEELPGILNWSLVGLFNLLQRGHLVVPSSSTRLRDEHRRACNSARMFIEENLCHISGAELPKQAVFDEYKAFCKDGGYSPMNEVHFAQQVYRYFDDRVQSVRRRLGNRGVRTQVYAGLAWGKDDSDRGNQGSLGDFRLGRSEAGGAVVQGDLGNQGSLSQIPNVESKTGEGN